jgi:predicted  nucleic acid-binding Zn-ribbon protein
MADDIIREPDEIQDTDIVFDCPHCGKSLCIDYRGAGLNITCTDCDEEVVVPIPNGMELDDLDSSPEDQEIRIINLRNSLAQSEARVSELAAQVEFLSSRCAALEESQVAVHENTAEIRERIAIVQKAQADIYRAVDGISELIGLAESAHATSAQGSDNGTVE